MCVLWRGAVADDGYGRFAIVRCGREYTVRSTRYAAALQLGVPLRYGEVVEHWRCDTLVCHKAHPDPTIGHLWPSTQAANLRRRAEKGRGNHGDWWVRRWSQLSGPARAERSRQLRDAVADGVWHEQAIRAVLLRIDPAQTVLFTSR